MTTLLTSPRAAHAPAPAAPPASRAVSRCEVCGAADLLPVLDLGEHALCDDLVPVGEARDCAKYPVRIGYCPRCRTAHQMAQVPKEALFPATYHYRARLTGDVLRGMEALVAQVEAELGSVDGKCVLDVGCNDGSLLSFFRARGARTFGIEPTDAARDARAAGHTVVRAYADPAVAAAFVAEHGHPDLVTFTNVFAHIEDLDALLETVRRLVGPATRVVIENHYLGAVVARAQFDTFYHEHPRTYSATSFAWVARRLGMVLARVAFPSRYGGNIRVILAPAPASAQAPEASEALPDESGFGEALRAMGGQVARWRRAKRAEIDALVARHGPLRAKAFPGRAAILVELLGLSTAQVAAVYEQPGSVKLGHYLPGTRIPIVSDASFDAADPAPVLNLAWHIPGEIERYLRSAGYAGPIIPVMTPDAA